VGMRWVTAGVVVVVGVVGGPMVGLWAFLSSPCGPDSTVDVCVLAAPHVVAVLLPAVGGPVAAVLLGLLALVPRTRPAVRGRVLVGATVAVVAVLVTPPVIIAVAPSSYPNDFVPRA
jgi:hypothetical protein